jgi:hypothetical protein
MVIASQSKSELTELNGMTRTFSKVLSEALSIASRCLLRDGLSLHTTQGLVAPFLWAITLQSESESARPFVFFARAQLVAGCVHFPWSRFLVHKSA